MRRIKIILYGWMLRFWNWDIKRQHRLNAESLERLHKARENKRGILEEMGRLI